MHVAHTQDEWWLIVEKKGMEEKEQSTRGSMLQCRWSDQRMTVEAAIMVVSAVLRQASELVGQKALMFVSLYSRILYFINS